MKTNTTYSLLIASLLIPVINVHALEMSASTSVNVGNTRMEMQQEMRRENKDNRMEMRASTTAGSPERMEMRKENMDNRAEFRAEVQTKMQALRASIKEARTKKLDGNAKARVEMKLGKIYERLMNRVDRLTKIDAEITKRLSVRTNTATALSLQAAAQTALAKARVDVEATKAMSSVELNATTSKEVLRGLVNTAETSIKATGEAYKKVVEAMKDLPKIEISASSTINN